MKSLSLKFSLFALVLCSGFIAAADLPENLQKRVDSFTSVSTQKAQMLLRGFTVTELQQITYEFKKKSSKEDARMLWLIEEYYLREADRIASERIFYLFLAIILLFVTILIFVFRIYRNSLPSQATQLLASAAHSADHGTAVKPAKKTRVSSPKKSGKKK